MSDASIGLSRRELERELRWATRRIHAGTPPEEATEILLHAVVDLIDRNNRALAESLAARERDPEGEDF